MTTSEEWNPIPGYEGLYEASSLGRVRSLARTMVTKNRWGHAVERPVLARILKQRTDRTGYKRVNLAKAGSVATVGVHRLVCLAFHGPCAGREASHGDGDPANNRRDNLRWATPVQNQSDRCHHGRDPRGARNGRAKITPEIATEILRRLGTETGKSLAAEYGISPSMVVHIRKGRNWKA